MIIEDNLAISQIIRGGSATSKGQRKVVGHPNNGGGWRLINNNPKTDEANAKDWKIEKFKFSTNQFVKIFCPLYFTRSQSKLTKQI